MFIGHFALGVATKKIAPTLPIWILLLAPQFMDLMFMPLVALGIEGYEPGAYGHDTLDALYTHSLVGAAVIAALAYWIGDKFWRDSNGGLILAALSFSHWIIDLFVHHQDMAILPGNLGGFPLLGFGLWNFEYSVFAIEVAMAIIAIGFICAMGEGRKERTALVRWSCACYRLFRHTHRGGYSETASTIIETTQDTASRSGKYTLGVNQQ